MGVWILFLLGLELASARFGEHGHHVELLVGTTLSTLLLVTLFALVGLRRVPPELRTLRIVAVVLPSAYVVLVEVVLYLMWIHGVVSEVGQHVMETALLSAGAVPFAVYVFNVFARLRNDLADRARHLQDLHESSMALTRELALPRLGKLIVDGAVGVTRSDRGFLRLADDEGPAGAAASSPVGSGPLRDEADLLRSVAGRGASIRSAAVGHSSLGVPLLAGGRALGALVVARESGAEFSAEDELLLDMFGVAASAGIENAHRLEEAQLLATVEERERIARDLHDDLGQLLGFLTTKIQAVQELVIRERDAEATEELAGLERATRMLGTQVREAILGLRARVGPNRPLGEALEEYLADFGVLAGLETRFEGSPEAGRDLPGPQQYQLLRIAQEALSNARRHARARRVTVRLAEAAECLELSVADDGVGFDPKASTTGFGLKTMAERAEVLDGALRVDSAPGTGTDIHVHIPLKEA